MRLIINNKYSANLTPFIVSTVIPKASLIFHSLIDQKRCIPYQKFLFEKYGRNVNVFSLLSLGIKNLRVNRNGSVYEVFIDPNINAPGIPAKLVNICALVNYGNLALLPYQIFDKVMDLLGNQVPSLYLKYRLGGGK